jgi:uncharacterized MnhB-related membrane protein
LNFDVAQVLFLIVAHLFLVSLHSPLKAIVVYGSFGSDSHGVIVEELDALDVMLEAAIGEIVYIRHVGHLEFLGIA